MNVEQQASHITPAELCTFSGKVAVLLELLELWQFGSVHHWAMPRCFLSMFSLLGLFSSLFGTLSSLWTSNAYCHSTASVKISKQNSEVHISSTYWSVCISILWKESDDLLGTAIFSLASVGCNLWTHCQPLLAHTLPVKLIHNMGLGTTG